MKPHEETFQKAPVLTVAASHCLHDVFTSFFAPLIPLLSEKLGFSYATAGLLSVLQKIPSLTNPLLGYIADRLVVKWFLIVTPLITACAMSFLGLAPSLTALGILLLISGFSAALYHVSSPVIMRQVSGSKIGTGMSFFMFGGELARTIGPLLIVSAVSLWGLEGTYRLLPIAFLGSLVLYFQVRKLPHVHIAKKEKGEARESSWVAISKMKPLFSIIVPILLFRSFSKTALTLFLPAYLVEQNMSILHAGYTLALLEGFAAIGVLLSGSLSDVWGRKSILLTIMAITPLLMYAFTLSSGITQLVLIALMGLVFFASTPVFMAMVHEMNSQYPSLANGIFMMLSFALTSIVSLLIGYWGDWYGLQHTFQLTAFLSIGAIPFVLKINSQVHQ